MNADLPQSRGPLAHALRQPLLLGLFLPIQDGGWSISTLPRSTTWDFEYNKRLTLQAEALGFDLVFGLAQWLSKGGHGGGMRYRENALDSFIATAALSSVTSRILLISTIHVLYGPWHPLHLAKYGATLDHISGGRWGVNIVTGHVGAEWRMFGKTRVEHDLRYEMADEFTDIAKRLWLSDENLSLDARFWSLEDAFVSPRPAHGRPILVNATGSEAGFAFAARHSDLVFVPSPTGVEIEPTLKALPAFVGRLKAKAHEQGREVRAIINPTIISGATDAEAQAYYRAIIAAEDKDASAGFNARVRGDSDAHAWSSHRPVEGARAVGGNLHIVGGPERIRDDLIRLKRAGIDGVQLSFFDFERDLAFFGREILPLLHEAGLRV